MEAINGEISPQIGKISSKERTRKETSSTETLEPIKYVSACYLRT